MDSSTYAVCTMVRMMLLRRIYTPFGVPVTCQPNSLGKHLFLTILALIWTVLWWVSEPVEGFKIQRGNWLFVWNHLTNLSPMVKWPGKIWV